MRRDCIILSQFGPPKSKVKDVIYTPLNQLPKTGAVFTAGRVSEASLTDAHCRIRVLWNHDCPPDGALVRVQGVMMDGALSAESVEVTFRSNRTLLPELGSALTLRASALQSIRRFFHTEGFLEVETANWVSEPGTDVHLEPFEASLEWGEQRIEGFLHTSPEFAMKRLLVQGAGRIYQVCKVYRNGEVTPLHNPEFTIVEWYRPWESLDAIIADVESIVRLCIPGMRGREIVRAPMAELVEAACGISILDALDLESLRAACIDTEALVPREDAHWDDLFFELMVEHVDPYIATLGAVVVTDWPAPLAVLAERNAADPRVAHRFEMYVDGVELANGFQELTDPDEQRERFQADNVARRDRGKREYPMPERFLSALECGLPPSSGVAVGFDRILMLAAAAADLEAVLPEKWRAP